MSILKKYQVALELLDKEKIEECIHDDYALLITPKEKYSIKLKLFSGQ